MDVEVCEQVEAPLRDAGRVQVRDLPATTVASTIHQGPYATIGEAYGALMYWIGQNGYRVVDSNREIYIRGMEHGAAPADYVTEVQFPVERS